MAITLNTQTDDPFEALYLLQADESALVATTPGVEMELGKIGTIWSFKQSDKIKKAVDAKSKTLDVETATAGLAKLGITLALPSLGSGRKPRATAARHKKQDWAEAAEILRKEGATDKKPMASKDAIAVLKRAGFSVRNWSNIGEIKNLIRK